jgi:arginine-tRNA-protein transferase
MYDPDFNEWGLGKYSALREIMFTHSLSRDNPSIKYYCMGKCMLHIIIVVICILSVEIGLYIHTCVKMRYKGQYKPSELLEPVRLNYIGKQFTYSFLNRRQTLGIY